MNQVVSLFQAAIVFGTVIMFGSIGEILTEKSGSLNLGVPGIMYLGGIASLVSAFLYEGACAKAGSLTSDPDACNSQDLNEIIHTIINTVIFVVGMLAVIMIILGGVNYATSQGDPNKVNKAKSTIMDGIIGLVICLLAFAIVNFVLQALA